MADFPPWADLTDAVVCEIANRLPCEYDRAHLPASADHGASPSDGSSRPCCLLRLILAPSPISAPLSYFLAHDSVVVIVRIYRGSDARCVRAGVSSES
ncbi:hypothetical protein E2562_016899 [Oryza meyeriana var. granulata]|uniref:Uncharacterized protein n=1 Tax=Oryza meyeriana var. granulata TaxID=110450 RepID=A0A6G1DY01_9ORYZ|nr:hypothetical protein E2562_016899 [Oryza meyeriana var. granulata]